MDALIGHYITLTIHESARRTVFREGLVVDYKKGGQWVAYDRAGLFTFSFDDFLHNRLYISSTSSSS
jgi:hypothetical protein